MNKTKITKNKLIYMKTICPICKKHHFSSVNSYEICPICGWEDDKTQRIDPNYYGGANKLSINEYKKNYEKNK